MQLKLTDSRSAVCLTMFVLAQLVRNIYTITEAEGLLPCSEEPTIGPLANWSDSSSDSFWDLI